MSDIWVMDTEGDGLDATKLHCLAAADPKVGKVFVTSKYDDMRKFLSSAKVIIAHNCIRWDIPTLERILGIKIKAKLIDTLALSWYLYPMKNKHGLEAWGEHYGIPKPFIADWDNQTQEEYEHRCHEDVRINTMLWNDMYQYLLSLYGSDEKLWKFLDYLSFKMYCARLQEESQWKLDVQFASDALRELERVQTEKKEALTKAMPKVPSFKTKSRPKRFINKNGDYTKLGMEWIKLLTDMGLPPDHEEDIEIPDGEADGNPSSPEQLKRWLDNLGWKPRTFKYVKDKTTGEMRAIPQINLEHGKGICDSIKDLYEVEPNLELLDGLSVLSHRIGVLKGFLKNEKNGYLKAQIKGLTNTLRFQHTTIVNLPKVGKLYADAIRASLVAPPGYKLCGSDMASLEDRIKQHFIYPYDPKYVESMNQEGFDPHLIIAVIAGMCTQYEADTYKWYANLKDEEKVVADAVRVRLAKTIKPVRDIAKNGNYACQYGAGPSRLVLTCGISLDAARNLHKAYWELNWAIRKVASVQTTKTINDQMWLLNPVSGFWYSLRFEKDIFSTLVQGTASFVFDTWLGFVLDERPQLTGQFHDEFILCIKNGSEEKCSWLLEDSLKKTNEKLKLNRELGISIQYGNRYSDIH